MIDHITFYVKHLQKSAEFYDLLLAPLNMKRNMGDLSEGYIGYGADTNPEIEIADESNIWLVEENNIPSKHLHLALRASSKEQVDNFYTAGLHAGGTDNGKPGIRKEYSENYYAAFILDPDGNNIECVTYL